MKVKVRVFGDLIRVLGDELTVTLNDNAILDDLLKKLAEMIPNSKKGFIGSYRIGQTITVLVNGRNIHTFTNTIFLKNGDIIALFPPFVGG